MQRSAHMTNHVLAALIDGGGFTSRERFADAVNMRGWHMHGVKLSYDHVTVKRWLSGSLCQNVDVVAAVLSDAWGIPVPEQVIWPQLRDGNGRAPAHLQAWSAARTLEDLAAFVGSDMLTRRETLTDAVAVATGTSLVKPLTRWLGSELPASLASHTGAQRIGVADVLRIERATTEFMAVDASAGGGVCREAAVGQLKYAVDLAKHATFRDAVGHRLLAAIADLAGWIGWMSHDLAMAGPAQRYMVYGLQAARESRDERARLRAVGILIDLATQQRSLGHPDAGLRLVGLAFDTLPADGRKLNKVRSLLWSMRAQMLSGMGLGYLPEVRSAIGLSFDLYGQTSEEDNAPTVTVSFPYTNEAELAGAAAACYRRLAMEDRRLAGEVADQAGNALARRPESFARSRVFDRIELAWAWLLDGDRDAAVLEGRRAARMAGRVSASLRVSTELQGLRRAVVPGIVVPLS